MAQMAGLGALPYAMSGGGFAPAPQRTPMAGLGPVEQPTAPAPVPTFTMADRSNAIYALSRQGLSPDEIKAQLAAMGMIDPTGVITPEAEVEPVEEAGIGTLLRTGALNIGAMTGEGVGTIQQALGFEEAGQATKDAAAEAFALSPEDQQALALRAEGKGIIGQGVDAAIQSSPQMVGTLAAGVAGGKTGAAIGSLIAPGPGTAIGAAIGAVLGGTFVNLPTLIGSASQRAESLGQDVNDPAVRDEILAVGAANAIGESLINLIPGGKAASVGFKTAAQLAAQQATRKAVGRVATVGAKAALLEATTEAAQVLTEVIAFDDDLRAQMDEGEITAMLPLIKERYGEELAVSVVAGGLMGGVAGGGVGAVQDKQYRGALAKEESDRAEAIASLKTAAERGGLAPDALDAAVNDPERSAIVKSGAQMLNAAKQEVMTAQQMRDGAIASGDPDMIDAANKRLQEALAQADTAYDAVIPKLGGLSSAQARAADADRANAAREALVQAGVANPSTIASLPDSEVRGLERDFSLAQKKVEAAKQALNGPDMFETAKRQKAQAELDKAQLEFEKTQRRITIKTGLETEESIRQKAVAKQQADQREAVVQRQFDREFKPLIDAGRTDEAQAKAQAIIARVAGQPDKALENQIAKLEAKLQRATTPDEMDRLEAQIAARKARRGQEAPIVAAANRVLGSAGSQQAGVGVQGPSPAPAGQSAAPTATTGTATPAAPTVTPASVPPVTQGQQAAAGLVPPQPQQALAAGPTVVPPAAAPTSTAPITPAASVGTAQNPIPTPENPLGYVPTGTPIQQVEAYSKAKLVAPPEVTLAAAPEILKRAEAARKAAGLNPDATRVELFAAGGGRQSSLEADLESALGLPYGASPSQLRAALQARQDAAPKPETVEPGAQPETKPETVEPGAQPETKPDTDLAPPPAPEPTPQPTPPPAPEPTPQPTPAQVQAQAQAEAEAAATQAKLDAQYIPPPSYDPKAVDPQKRRSSFPNYTDAMDILQRNSINLADATAFVLDQAKRNGFENYVAWDADTGEVLGAGTTNRTHEVGFSRAFRQAVRDGRRVEFVHNHPTTGSLSTGDVDFLSTLGENVILHAVASNGNTFTMQMTPTGVASLNEYRFAGPKRNVNKRLQDILGKANLEARKAVIAAGLAQPGPRQGDAERGVFASSAEESAVFLDVRRAVNQALAEMGLVVYSEVDTTPRTQRQDLAIQTGKENAVKAIRRSFAVSPSGGPADADTGLGAVQQPEGVRSDGPVSETAEAPNRGSPRDNTRERPDTSYQNEPSDELIVAQDQSNPVMQDVVDTFRQMMPGARQTIEVPDWLNVDPGGESALKSAMEAAKTPQRTLGRVGTFLETQLVNSLAPIRNLEMKVKGALGIGMDSAFKAAEIAVNDSGRNEQLMLYGAMKLGPNGEPRIAPGTIGLRQMLGKLRTKGMTDEQAGQSVVDWMAYMGARRAEEYKAKGLKPPLTDQEIADGMAKRSPLFDEVAADWKRFNDANVDFLVDTGRISKVLADKLKSDAAYIPFYRSDESMDGVPDLYDQAGIEKASNDLIRSGGSLLARNPRIQKLKGGGDKKVENLVNNMVRNSQAIVAAGMRNYAANKTFDILQNSGYAKVVNARQQNAKGDYVRVEKPENAIRIWRDGQESYLVPETADAMPVMLALASMEPVRLSGIARFMASVGSFFRQAITLNPGFMVRNHFRDTVSVAVLTGGKNLRINPLEGVGRGLDIMGKRTITRQSFTTLSGMGDYRFGGADVGLGSNDFLMELGVEPKTLGYRFRQAIGALETVGTAFELANRLTYYETLIQQGVRADEAAYQALTLVNYNRRGASAMLRGLLPMVPFLNARIQGLARLYEDAVTNSPGKRLAAMTKLAINGSILSAFSAALWAWNNEDEERREKYEAEPLHRRLNYNIIYLPGDKTLLLPKAFEIGTVFGSSVEMLLEAAVQGDTDELGAATAMTLFNTFAFNPIPQAMVPALEILFNYNMFTGQPIEGRRMDDDLLTERINPQTSALAIALSQNGLGRLTGMSPIQFDHLMQGYGGLAYSFPATIIDVVAGNMGWIPSKPSGVFEAALPDATPGVVKGITTGLLKETFASVFKDQKDDGANRWVEEFYSRRIAIEQLYRTARDAAEDGDIARAKELLARAPASPAAYRLVSKAGDRLGEINTAMREIRQDPKMTADQKRAALQPLIAARNKMAGQVMQVIRDLEEKQGTSFRRAAY